GLEGGDILPKRALESVESGPGAFLSMSGQEFPIDLVQRRQAVGEGAVQVEEDAGRLSMVRVSILIFGGPSKGDVPVNGDDLSRVVDDLVSLVQQPVSRPDEGADRSHVRLLDLG